MTEAPIPAFLSVVAVLGLILVLFRLARIERAVNTVLSGSVAPLSERLETIRSTVASDTIAHQRALRGIRKELRQLCTLADQQLATLSAVAKAPESRPLEIRVVGRLIRDLAGRTSFPVKLAEGEDATLIPVDVTEELAVQAAQRNGGVPVRWGAYESPGNDGYWFFRDHALKITGSLGIPLDELVARIKHKAIRQDKELATLMQELEEFENGLR